MVKPVPDAQPRRWCTPQDAFGKVPRYAVNGRLMSDVPVREWFPPSADDAVAMAKFKAAVMQNAICVHVRDYKNQHNFVREVIVGADNRPDAAQRWKERFNGRENLTTADIAFLISVLPEGVPTPEEINRFVMVVTGEIKPPDDWKWPDVCGNP